MIDIVNELYTSGSPVDTSQWDFYIFDEFGSSWESISQGTVNNALAFASKASANFNIPQNLNPLTIPNACIESIEVPTGLPQINLAKAKDFTQYENTAEIDNSLKLTIRETKSFNILNYFKIWIGRIFDLDKQCFKDDYRNVKKMGFLFFTDNVEGQSDVPIKTFMFENLRFKDIDSTLSLSHTSGDILKYNVNLVCDRAKIL